MRFATLKDEKAKVKVVGKNLDLLTPLVATSKYLAKRISKEKGVSLKKKQNI